MSEDGVEQSIGGLDEAYDLVLLGTGLVQSILSCVASKHGMKVLHLESNEFYGEEYSSHNLSSHINNYNSKISPHMEKNNQDNVKNGDTRLKQEGSGDSSYLAQFYDNISCKKELIKFGRCQPKSTIINPVCFGYVMENVLDDHSANNHPVFRNYLSSHHLTPARMWIKDREFNIDTTSKVLFASSSMVDLMVVSGVGNYLEFKTVEGLYFWMDEKTGTAGNAWKVPCSRGDVFNTTMLNALEKRTLMKFHQFVADWGRTTCGTEVASLNESELAVGRSLYRPQNRQTFSGYNVDAFTDKPFAEFLTDCKMSYKLQRIVVYALCCYSGTDLSAADKYITREALKDMFLHIDSIGKFGDTAFLSPMYGSSEIVQAFCRMSAVWGGTFILRRSVGSVTIEDIDTPQNLDKLSSKPLEDSAMRFCSRTKAVSVTDSEGNKIRCGAFVCSAGYWPGVPTHQCFVVSCTSVWLGTVVPLARSIIIIPPCTKSDNSTTGESQGLGNEYPVHILQTDASTCAAPDGAVVLHMTTTISYSAVDGSSWKEEAEKHASRAVSLMEEVVSQLKQSMVDKTETTSAQELSRVVTLRPIYDLTATSHKAGASDAADLQPWCATLPGNVRLCTGSSGASLSMQGAYDEAHSIFHQLFPDKDFTLNNLEDEVGDGVVRDGGSSFDNDDDDTAYLEFTLQSTLPKNSGEDTVECSDAAL